MLKDLFNLFSKKSAEENLTDIDNLTATFKQTFWTRKRAKNLNRYTL